MPLSVAPVSNPSFGGVQAPNNPQHITGVISATPGSNGFAGLSQPSAIPVQPVQTGVGGSGSGSGSTSTPLSQAIISAMQASIQDAINKNQAAYDAAKTQNAGADANAEGAFNNQVQSNTGSRATAIQNADQAAAQGNQGLRAVLASLGALNGTGQVLAGRAVANSANNDIGSADTTYTTNNEAIQQAHKDTLNQEAARNAALDTALNTNNNSARASGIQNILTAAHDQGDMATYNRFLPQLVQADAVPNQAIQPTPIVYANAPTSTYAPNSSQTVTAGPSQGAAAASTTPVNSALYTKKTG